MVSRWFAFLPNLITIGRLALTPAVIAFALDEAWSAAFLVFVVAGVSDALDGWIAKTYRLESELGAALDPIADKALIISIYICLAAAAIVPAWLAILIVSRDALIVGGVILAWFLARPVDVRPLAISKITTAAQLILAGVALAGQAYGVRVEAVDAILTGSVAALTVTSASVYLWLWVLHMRP